MISGGGGVGEGLLEAADQCFFHIDVSLLFSVPLPLSQIYFRKRKKELPEFQALLTEAGRVRTPTGQGDPQLPVSVNAVSLPLALRGSVPTIALGTIASTELCG